MGITHAQKLAFAKTMIEILENNKEKLQEKGVDVEGRIKELRQQVDNAAKAEADQQQEQSEARGATTEANETLDAAYNNASASVELIVGALGKDDPLVLEIKNIRDEMANEANRGPRDEDSDESGQ